MKVLKRFKAMKMDRDVVNSMDTLILVWKMELKMMKVMDTVQKTELELQEDTLRMLVESKFSEKK